MKTSGVGVKPALLPFEGKAFHNRAAAATPRSACAAAAHTPQGEVPPGAPTPPLVGIGGCVCHPSGKNRPYAPAGGADGA
jgi:hypothetical protein